MHQNHHRESTPFQHFNWKAFYFNISILNERQRITFDGVFFYFIVAFSPSRCLSFIHTSLLTWIALCKGKSQSIAQFTICFFSTVFIFYGERKKKFLPQNALSLSNFIFILSSVLLYRFRFIILCNGSARIGLCTLSGFCLAHFCSLYAWL